MLLRMEFLRIVCALSILVILFAKPFESVVVARRTKPATKAIADGGSSRNSMWKSLINRVKKLIVKPKTLKIRTALTTPAGNRLLKVSACCVLGMLSEH